MRVILHVVSFYLSQRASDELFSAFIHTQLTMMWYELCGGASLCVCARDCIYYLLNERVCMCYDAASFEKTFFFCAPRRFFVQPEVERKKTFLLSFDFAHKIHPYMRIRDDVIQVIYYLLHSTCAIKYPFFIYSIWLHGQKNKIKMWYATGSIDPILE